MDILYISPEFPPNYANFVRSLHAEGIRVWAVGETDFYSMPADLRACIRWYARTELNNWRKVEQGINELLEVKHAQGFEGAFDLVESHNEAWLRLEAFINERFDIPGITLREVDRLKKEGGVRLPEIEERSSRAKIVEMKGSMGTPVMLTDEGELLESIGGWFPKRTGAEPFGAEMDASMKKNAVAAWQGNEVKVVLSKTGRWQVANFFEQDRGRFARELDSRLQSVPGPIKDLSVNARWEDDKDKGLAFALWIE